MSSSEVLMPSRANYATLIGGDKQYKVPPYQRDYSWTKDHWEDLWQDIVNLRENPEDNHYLGSIVVIQGGGHRSLFRGD